MTVAALFVPYLLPFEILPWKERWQRGAPVEGYRFQVARYPSTSLRLVPLPLRGRICCG